MALGIPTVATAIGCNDRVIEDGVSGYLVSTPEEWIARLSQLLDDPQLRRMIGRNARDRVERFYSVDANKHAYLSIFESVYGKPSVVC
jgi:glycosyltransferase involved in cell wall biosynthesis